MLAAVIGQTTQRKHRQRMRSLVCLYCEVEGKDRGKKAHEDVDEEGQGDVLQAQQLAGHRDEQERDREEDEQLQGAAGHMRSVGKGTKCICSL
jgi:hypothetical protein